MNAAQPDILTLITISAALALIPFAVVTLTAFLKISVILFLVRNALGTQQTPPNLVLYAVAIVLTVAAAILLVRIGARVYERTLLRTGRKISFREALAQSRVDDAAATTT